MLPGEIALLPSENTDFENLQVLQRLFMHEILHINFHDYVAIWHSHGSTRLYWKSK